MDRRTFIKLTVIAPTIVPVVALAMQQQALEELPPSVTDADVFWEDSPNIVQPIRVLISGINTEEKEYVYFEIPAVVTLGVDAIKIIAKSDFKVDIIKPVVLYRIEAKVPKHISKFIGKSWAIMPSIEKPMPLYQGDDLTLAFSSKGLCSISM